MTNLFKTRYLPNADGTESTTALTNANTVFIHTYLGDDSTGDGTREKPYRSMTKALTKAGTHILFRGLINETFNSAKIIIGDDISQVLLITISTNTAFVSARMTTIKGTVDQSSTNNPFFSCIVSRVASQVVNQYFGGYKSYNLFYVFNQKWYGSGVTFAYNTYVDVWLMSHQSTYASIFNNIYIKRINLNTSYPPYIANSKGNLFFKRNIWLINNIPLITPNSINNDDWVNALICGGLSETLARGIFSTDIFDNSNNKVIDEFRAGGTAPNVFNKYAPNLTGKLNAAVTTGAKTSVTINVADANQCPTTGDLFMPTETAYAANGVTMPIGSFEVWSYTSVTIVSPTRITLNGPSYTFKTAHSDLNKDCTRYGDVLDYTLNPDPQNEALWASDTGGYVGCFRPAYACDVETGLSAISNVDENGTNSGLGDLFQIVNGELKFNSASSQLWNRMSDTTTINIPNGSNFKGLNAMSQDGSPFGYYIGKKQTLISPTAIAAGNALTVGKWYKVYNDNGNSVSEAIVYNGVQYLPEYTFLCVTGVTTFSELEPGSGSYVKEILSGVLESIEILPYNDMTTPSIFPKFSAPLMGECKLIFYTASGAARYGKTAGDPVKFADLDLANMITDFGTVKNKISYYDTWAISNADSEFYLLTNAGLSTTLKGYFTQDIPAIKYLRREINGHFDMPYDY